MLIQLGKYQVKDMNVYIDLVMDPHPTEEKEAKRNELCHRALYLEVRNNESFAKTIVQ